MRRTFKKCNTARRRRDRGGGGSVALQGVSWRVSSAPSWAKYAGRDAQHMEASDVGAVGSAGDDRAFVRPQSERSVRSKGDAGVGVKGADRGRRSDDQEIVHFARAAAHAGRLADGSIRELAKAPRAAIEKRFDRYYKELTSAIADQEDSPSTVISRC